MASEPVFKLNDADGGSDSLEAYCHGGQVTIQIEEPWAGSTETGFGQSCSMGLSLDDAESLGRWLLATVDRTRLAGDR